MAETDAWKKVCHSVTSDFVSKLGLLFLLMTKDMSKNWMLDCNVEQNPFWCQLYQYITVYHSISLINHATFLAFAFASLAAVDTV